jgi:glycerol-3-phosphate dehydrogenase
VVVDCDAFAVGARAVVNASGPWVDEIRRLEDPSARPSVRLSKGSHVLLRLREPWTAALTIPHDNVRVSFAVPWEGMLLLGTTDVLYEGSPGPVEATDAEVAQILAEAAVAVAPELLRPDAICSTFAGLRVLPGGDGATASARRETVFHRGPAGMLSVAGGKLTTYRRIALTVLGMLREELGLPAVNVAPFQLPGAAVPELVAARLAREWPQLEPGVRDHLAHLYGSLAEEVLAPAAEDPQLLRPLHPAGPDIVAQAVYARDVEWARSSEDIVRRRTTLALRGLDDTRTVSSIETILRGSVGALRG